MRVNQLSVVVCLIICVQLVAEAQYAPVDGAEDLTDLYSPVMLGEGAPVTFGEGPQADVINPSLSGMVQRTTLDASYIALTGFGDRASGSAWQGHILNLGIVTPTRAAVFSGSFHFVSSALTGMPFGTSAWLHGSASKELYPGWLVGLGARVGGGFADTFSIGVAVDLGMLRQMGNIGPFSDFVWGVVLQNIGKWYDPFASFSALPSPFTPAAGVSFTAYDGDSLRVEASGSLSAPSFRNLRAGLSGRVTLFDSVSIHAGWKADLRQIMDPQISARSLIPSFGLTAKFRAGLDNEGFAADRGWTETEIQTSAVAAPLYNGIWAFGGGVNAPLGIIDTRGPDVKLTYPERLYISPNNDGTFDDLSVPISISDERFIMNWRFEVVSSDGRTIRTIHNKDERPENEGFQSIVDRLLDVRTGVQVPERIRWDGSTDRGEIAADDIYTFRVFAEDDNGNVGVSDDQEVIVDSTAPQIFVVAGQNGNRTFSPNGDGTKDAFAIVQSGSTEDLWQADIVNSFGIAVWSHEWIESPPADVEWNGRSVNGESLPDGVYRYLISSVDAAGNRTRGEVANIIVNTESTPVALTVSTSYFSPNGDGRVDTVTISPSVPNTGGISDWDLVITDSDGEVIRRYGDTQIAPLPIIYDGISDDQTLIEEGIYRAVLTVRYANGNAPSGVSPDFVVDMTPPTVAVQSERALFSPNGDGKLDTVSFFQETSREDRWVGAVSTLSGQIVRSATWPTLADQRVTWNGRQDDGRLVVDGTYTYTLESTDRAGNRTISRPVEIIVDTSDAEIGLRAEFEAFSPNADNLLDRQRLFVRVDREDDVESYEVTILNSTGDIVRRFAGRNIIQPSFMWDGTQANGRRVSDGTYQAQLVVNFVNGNDISAGTGDFFVDTKAPSVTVTLPYHLFSPDGDNERDSIRIVQVSSEEDAWSGTIRDSSGALLQEYIWVGKVGAVDWDGRDSAGNIAGDGTYAYQIGATDRAGNSTIVDIPGIVLDTREPRVFATSSTSAFSPNADGVRDEFLLDMYANLLDGATEWRLTIRTVSGLVVKEFSGSELLENRTVAWDGRDGLGRLREGEFTAEFSIDYEKGNRPTTSTGMFRVDVSKPEIAVNLAPLPFSPDNDGVDDELQISLSVSDQSPIRAWRLEIFDRNDRYFTDFSGQGMPAARLIWGGRASDGELVISAEDYPYRLTVSDELGNTAVREGVIPVDILVIRDGDRLKVQISSITFAPNSPELIIDVEDERGAKNRAILIRLAEIFDKYASYSIGIEGHAVNVSGTDREEREELQPLSLSRAQSVKDAMVELGISERRVSVIGRGGTEPVVPHDDTDNRWKNRRVEFVLIR